MSRLTNDVPGVTLGFTGHEQEDDLGLINMKGRIYDPTTMRFLSADPLVARPLRSQGFNRYSYSNNSPFRWIDPTGLQQELANGGSDDGLRSLPTPTTPEGDGVGKNVKTAEPAVKRRGSGIGGIDDQGGGRVQGTQTTSLNGFYNGAGDNFKNTVPMYQGLEVAAAAPWLFELIAAAGGWLYTTAETFVATSLAPETIAGTSAVVGAISGAAPAEAPLPGRAAQHLGAAAANVPFRAIANTRGLEHSFKHAAQWFGRAVSGTDMKAWQALVERASGSSLQVSWSAFDSPTVGHLARIEGKYLFTQFFVGGPRAGELATAFIPSQSQLTAILNLLGH
jgi:RHS repeat-associated protein